MDFIDQMRKMMEKASDAKKSAICLLKDHPELERLDKESETTLKALGEKADALEKEAKDEKKKFWDALETYLVEQKLITQEERDDNIQMMIRDGVLFKVEE